MKTLLRTTMVLAGLVATGPALAQTVLPNKPMRMIVPFAAGGATDSVARLVAQQLSTNLGQPFHIENHTGAGGNIAMGLAAQSPPDGTTMLTVSNSYYVNPSLFGKVPYSLDDFAPVTMVATSPYLLAVHPSVPANNLQELIALLKANPGKYSYGSPGRGTPGHLAGELFRLPLGIDITHVPFKGGGPAIASTVGGHTPISFTSLPSGAPHVKQGTLRGIAVLSAKRSPALPDVPTSAEGGLPDLQMEIVSGMLLRAGTPQAQVEQMHREIAKAVAMPEVSGRMASLGFDPVVNTPAEFDAWLKAEFKKWAKVIADAKMQTP
jgi:tripartite-type tricarboxylate transporter receptor subunit TctC